MLVLLESLNLDGRTISWDIGMISRSILMVFVQGLEHP